MCVCMCVCVCVCVYKTTSWLEEFKKKKELVTLYVGVKPMENVQL